MPPAAQPPAKVCIVCKQDCSSRPRTKDEQGRYTCKACLDKRQAAAATAKSKPAAAPKTSPVAAPAFDQPDNDFMLQLVSDSPTASAPACPGCNMPMNPGAVICMACGYNTKTGQRMAVSVTKSPKEAGAGSKAAGLAGAAAVGAAKGTFAIVAPVIGGIIGGAIGAAIWAGVAYAAHLHWGWIAWGVGVLTGMGVAAGARGNTGSMTGALAVVIAIAAVAGGKYAEVSLYVDDIGNKVATKIHYTDQMAVGAVAQDVAREWQAAGRRLNWPEGMDPDSAKTASTKEEFPKEVWDEATKRWNANTEQWRTQYKSSKETELKAEFSATIQQVKGEGFSQSFTPFDILWFLLAIGSAYAVGSGTGMDD